MSFFLSYKPMTIKIKNSTIESSSSEKLSGVTIDSNFLFDNYMGQSIQEWTSKICGKQPLKNFTNFI